MRAVVQRVSEAAVVVAGQRVAAIGHGLLALIGAGEGDTEADADYIQEEWRRQGSNRPDSPWLECTGW